MMEDMFREFGNDKKFQKIVNKMVDTAIIDVNNKLKFSEISLDEEIIGATLLLIIKNKLGIEFLRTINMVINGSTSATFADVNEFLNQIELIYNEAENNRDKQLGGKVYGGE